MKTDPNLREDSITESFWNPAIDSSMARTKDKCGTVPLPRRGDGDPQNPVTNDAAPPSDASQGVAIERHTTLPGKGRRTDADIAQATGCALQWQVSVPGDIRILVRDGWVFLYGVVEGNCARNAVESCVSSLAGVAGVTNSIAIRLSASAENMTRWIDDARRRCTGGDGNAIEKGIERDTPGVSRAGTAWS